MTVYTWRGKLSVCWLETRPAPVVNHYLMWSRGLLTRTVVLSVVAVACCTLLACTLFQDVVQYINGGTSNQSKFILYFQLVSFCQYSVKGLFHINACQCTRFAR